MMNNLTKDQIGEVIRKQVKAWIEGNKQYPNSRFNWDICHNRVIADSILKSHNWSWIMLYQSV